MLQQPRGWVSIIGAGLLLTLAGASALHPASRYLVGRPSLRGAVATERAEAAEAAEEAEAENEGRTPAERLAAKCVPSDAWALRRSWPDATLDVAAYQAALDVARTQAQAQAQARGGASALFAGSWRLDGPTNISGRFNTVAPHPTDPRIMYAGAAEGGLWKTTNGGTTWAPLLDARPDLTVATITLQPGNPQVVYVGTGDPSIPRAANIGDGLLKSTDGGLTWVNLGLAAQSVISKVVVHPTNPLILYAATMGRPMAPGPDRGLYKSLNGGSTWTRVLFISPTAGISDLELDPTNPNTLYATGWDRQRTEQRSLITGTAARVYKSTDAGATWRIISGGGMPVGRARGSRMGLALARSAPQTLYVSVVDSTLNTGGLYKTTNGGTAWTRLPAAGLPPEVFAGFGWYFEQVFVSPTNPNLVFVGGVDLYRSTDGGQTFEMAGPPWFTYEVHADKHDVQWLPGPLGTIVLATDGGVYQSDDDGTTWLPAATLPVTQFYRVAVNPHQSGQYWGGAQDNGTTSGSYLAPDAWERVYGGDGFQMRFHPTDPQTYYVETQNGNIACTQDGGQSYQSVTDDLDPVERRNWDMPYLISPQNATTLLTGTQHVLRMTGAPNGTWQTISPDLTDSVNSTRAQFHSITALDQSARDGQRIWAGTVDGNVWRTVNGGTAWVNVTAGLPNRFVTDIQTSAITAGTAFVTHSGYRANEFIAHIHRTTNDGQTWTSIAGDLPPVGINAVLVVPGTQDRVLVVATDAGVYATRNGGARWERVGSDMPIIPVADLALDLPNRRLVAGTYARSIQSIALGVVTGLPATALVPEALTLTLYPNPATTELRYTLPASARAATIRVVEAATGRVVLAPRPAPGTGTPVDVRSLAPGAYVLELTLTDGRTVRRRFVVV